MVNIYDYPKYYDIAFGWDISTETNFLEDCHKKYGIVGTCHGVSLLELGCGTGRFLFEFTKRGYLIHGIDLNPNMVRYTREKAKRIGISISIELGDMANFTINEKYDLAFCSIDTFRYLLSDSEILNHFRCVNQSLKKGGLYIIDFGLLCDPEKHVGVGDTWTMEEEGINIKTTWSHIKKFDLIRKRTYDEGLMEITEGNKSFEIRDRYEARAWPLKDFCEVIDKTGFKIADWYEPDFDINKPIKKSEDLVGRVVVVLKRGG